MANFCYVSIPCKLPIFPILYIHLFIIMSNCTSCPLLNNHDQHKILLLNIHGYYDEGTLVDWTLNFLGHINLDQRLDGFGLFVTASFIARSPFFHASFVSSVNPFPSSSSNTPIRVTPRSCLSRQFSFSCSSKYVYQNLIIIL